MVSLTKILAFQRTNNVDQCQLEMTRETKLSLCYIYGCLGEKVL